MWVCPVCGLPLAENGGSFRCERNHNFDRSRSGYVHLLPADRMHGKMPGDNKTMVSARQRFLDGGYYCPLADAVASAVLKYVPDGALLDVGCGEGYYTGIVAAGREGEKPSCFGVDISKVALDKAARRCPTVSFAVASAFRLPVADGSFSGVLNLFAPYCGEELRRVLTSAGVLIMAIPGTDHLWELKQAVYDVPYKNEVKPFALDGFDLIDQQHLCYKIDLPDTQTVKDLFSMTPYYYKTGEKDQQKLDSIECLRVTAEFHVLVYRKA